MTINNQTDQSEKSLSALSSNRSSPNIADDHNDSYLASNRISPIFDSRLIRPCDEAMKELIERITASPRYKELSDWSIMKNILGSLRELKVYDAALTYKNQRDKFPRPSEIATVLDAAFGKTGELLEAIKDCHQS